MKDITVDYDIIPIRFYSDRILKSIDDTNTKYVVASLIHRYLRTSEGFICLCNDDNYDAAVPLLRILYETINRLVIFSICTDKESLSKEVLSGKRFSEIHIPEIVGNLTDKNINAAVSSLLRQFNPLSDMYEELCKDIHFSYHHLYYMIESDPRSISIGSNNFTRETITKIYNNFNYLYRCFITVLKFF